MGALGEVPLADAGHVASTPAEIDQKVARLGEARGAFARMPPLEKTHLLGDIRRRVHELSDRMATAACLAKGLDPSTDLYGEEVLAGPVASVHYLRMLERSLKDIARHGVPLLPADALHERPGGTTVRAVPLEAVDRLRFPGVEGEVWLDIPPEQATRARASFYREGAATSEVTLVLGAGNQAGIPPLDALHAMFVTGNTCLLKMSPVNAYLGPLLEQVFAPLVQRNFLAFAYGGADVGAYCTDHPGVSCIHITGSTETHDRIVWGTEPERSERKRRGEPRLAKRITSELGNVTPVIVPPGEYSDRELEHLARSVAGMMVHNASFNCISAKMLVLPKGSQIREELLKRVARELEAIPTRRAYYPGAAQRYARLTEGAPHVREIGSSSDGRLPWTLVTGLDSMTAADQFRTEPFCSILSEVPIGSADPLEFMEAARVFANEKLWGTLSAIVIEPSASARDRELHAATNRLIEGLEYGAVTVNAWSGFAFGLSALPWGAYPGSPLEDVRSGRGYSHNALMFEHVQKVVLRSPLVAIPLPFWYARRPLRALARAFEEYEVDPGPIRFAKLAAAALAP